MPWSPSVRPDEIYHWGISLGGRSKNHKYYTRINDGVNKDGTPRYRYFYSALEYQAYKVGKAAKDAANNVKQTFDNAADTARKALDTNTNIYDVNKKNYKEKREKIQNTDEWKEIIKDEKSEYHKTDSEGNEYYDYDQYLVDKKHPVLDAVSDYLHGREIKVRDQNADTFVAGVKDYIGMAIDTAKLAGNIAITVMDVRFKNQQGSYEETKQDLKERASNAKELAEKATRDMSEYDVDTEKVVEAATETRKQVREYMETNPYASAGVAAYAKENGLTYYEAQQELMNAPLSIIKKYTEQSRRR